MGKLVKTMITSLVILLFIAISAVVVVLNVTDGDKADKDESIEEIVNNSYQTPEVTTDLKDGRFVRIQFQVVTDGKDAHKEVSQRDFQISNILIKELAEMTSEDFTTGLSDLEENVKIKLNDLMTEGQITDVYTINKILQ